MRKILALSLLTFISCKKDNNTVQQYNYTGKWNISQSISKEYTLENGDTIYTKNEVTDYGAGAAWINFQSKYALMYINYSLDSMKYEPITQSYFNLDSTLCEITAFSDSAFLFNTLIFDNTAIPDKIQVKQDFFTLSK
ncbi:hypothetical protein GO495_27880 [Chitinophaga oryziterrae]|uniref:Lipocalin-like domain-containing protein n=1 Tax=Chitinophaga oryziterrae TaxID=1031224 RepID=A0A6N8JJA0_9BACT|nr:hypothetical protein [Chitinophaga oryziterrae]MVT44446.1 hypothetical protein [Chitinophaga oryziterrae]